MIVITGAAGFIGSNLLKELNNENFRDIVLVDDFSPEKIPNIEGKIYSQRVHRNDFHSWLTDNHRLVQFVFHLGARTDTAEISREVFDRLNLNYSKEVWRICTLFGLPLVYASSAATYGLGEHGFIDDHDLIYRLRPLNPYGESKNEFDKWVVAQDNKPYFWAGLKFFNVYGPNEYHKGRMASVILHAFNQIKETGSVKLFRSHNPEYQDGEQRRDFIFVRDVVNVMLYFMNHRKHPGIYNLGTGHACTFLDLAKNIFRSMGKEERIEFTDIPVDIRENYQYFTLAAMEKLKQAGYKGSFTSLGKGINDYVTGYLIPGRLN
ncbi:MAG: ADP-glyceromanno-heptose 6-epimerase [Bacteroidales bacterium]